MNKVRKASAKMATRAFVKSERLQKLPPYLFAEIDKKKKAAIAAGRDIINLGVGDPDRPTPAPIIQSLQRHVENSAFHQYALDQGSPEFRRAVATWFNKRYGVTLNADTEVIGLIGSKEGIAHLPLGVLNPGDISLVPDPCYPVYRSFSWFSGAETYAMPLRRENQFLPDLDAIPNEILRRTRLMFLNYPNNPTASVAPRGFFERVVQLAHEYGFVIAQDAAYSEMYYEERPISILQISGAKDVAIELHSFSKTFNMTGWRLGFAVGGAPIVAALGQVKANCDSGIFTAIQFAGITALEQYDELTPPIRNLYKERRDTLVGELRSIGWDVAPPPATFYVWIPCPANFTSTELCTKLLEEADIVTTPGIGFGETAGGYIRMALTVETPRIREAVARIGKLKF
jgi:LL-diaminopimelate aminotransferase